MYQTTATMKTMRNTMLLLIAMAAAAAQGQGNIPPGAPLVKPVKQPQHLASTGLRVPASTKEHYTFGTILDGDTVPFYQLREVTVYASGLLLTPQEISGNKKLIRNVRLMLPYAQEGRRRLDALELEIAGLPRKERKAAIKQAEKQLLADYKEEISNYTFSQGLVLIKLIDRETNRSAYKIVGELRGSLRAGLYQTLAKLFGYNLKDTFDPKHNKKDDLIDRICISIERGQI